MLPEGDGTVANVTLARELDAVLARIDGNCAGYVNSCLFLGIFWVCIPDSDMAIRSVVMRLNSEAGMAMVAAYSVSGMPRCSWSMSMSLRSYSEILSVSELSNTRLRTSGASSALRVRMSSFWAARSTLVREVRLMPRAMLRSQRNGEKPSALSIIDTSATWLLSIACRAIPLSLQSKLQSCTRSLIASTTCKRCLLERRKLPNQASPIQDVYTFFRMLACSNRASNMAAFVSFRILAVQPNRCWR